MMKKENVKKQQLRVVDEDERLMKFAAMSFAQARDTSSKLKAQKALDALNEMKNQKGKDYCQLKRDIENLLK